MPYFHSSKLWQISLSWGLGLLMVLALASPSQAHWADLSVADIQVREPDVTINLTIPTGLVTQFDDDGDRQLSAPEITRHQANLQQFLNEKIRLTAAGAKPNTSSVRAGVTQNLPNNLNATPETHSSLLLAYHWAQPIDRLNIDYKLFVPGVATARCLAQVFRNDRIDNLVFTPTSTTAALIDAPIWQQITSFIGLGIEHIWTGYDHILFLVSLLMLGGSLPYLLKVVTAFSFSHSFTLFLAAFNIISVPSRFVEIAIALSIAYIASESLWRKQPQARWQLAFAFGLIHGLGFSSALQELELPRTNLLTSLGSFSIGIELGQFAIVLIAYFLLSYLRKFSWDLTMRRLISVGIILMSAIWFWERVFVG
ncbi:HupE/UreJ family protein [Chamaesiphon sp. OTE_20_metabat_361]|uniref:HupE/UreJ family protein n=1 Tax=Chamaesiphon sp. OTE_20_metabat_361 TaxID=2964689 RepID=UPI00286B88EF|nr:HupE/UreJ family protein [Chamaesiphon sp. OTE_20_metabat_361]